MKFDFDAIDVKNKLVVLKATEEEFSFDEIDELGSQLRKLGALGFIRTAPGTELSALGEEEIENILKHMKRANDESD